MNFKYITNSKKKNSKIVIKASHVFHLIFSNTHLQELFVELGADLL